MAAPQLTTYKQGQGAVSADGLNTFEQTCDVIAQLRQLIGVPGLQICARGAVSVNDGLGSPFYWDQNSTAADDGVTVIKPIGGATAGRWIRLPYSAANIGFSQAANYPPDTVGRKLQQFIDIRDAPWNAKCDGVTDDSAAIIAALATFTNYVGGVLVIPANTAIAQTITITNKSGLIVTGENGYGFDFVGPSWVPTLKWIGAPGGTMIQLNNILQFTMRCMSISGNDLADYGLSFAGLQTGWGLGNYQHLTIYGCNKNAVYKTKNPAATLLDFGRNHWLRCTFRKSVPATGTPINDAIFVYNNDSGVQDVFDHCEWIYKDPFGATMPNTYCLWFEAGNPYIIFQNCYTVGYNGVFTKTGSSPIMRFVRHYSEDLNWLNVSSENTRIELMECRAVLGGGASIVWGGSGGGGQPILIEGGRFHGTVTLDNTNSGVILLGAPQFVGGWPTFTGGLPGEYINVGRAQGTTNENHHAINATTFCAASYDDTINVNINPSLAKGAICRKLLTGNALALAPVTIDASGRDDGCLIRIEVKGDAATPYTVTWNAIYKFSGGSAPALSGAGKLDIFSFEYDNGKNVWNEVGRSLNITATY